MLFNSIEFIFFFLPLSVVGYWLLRGKNHSFASGWLVCCSLFFYGWWNPAYLPLILLSSAVNYSIGEKLATQAKQQAASRGLLAVGVTFNLLLLGYFKYTDFLIVNINTVFSSNIGALHIVLPLAISFFTFQQISFLVDSYKGIIEEHSPLTYLLFVCFFPQLIAGPIVHHKQMMPQFNALKSQSLNYQHMAQGLYLFAIGLFKKVVVADEFAIIANSGYADTAALSLLEAWATSLSYSLQLYFDFSAYCDMGMGAALFFNIKLPINFNSPYKALSIQDFWRRWHITLSQFLRDYLYISLGGNRRGLPRTLLNLLTTFVIGGIWHGAGWTFIIWGALHGAALTLHRLWQVTGIQLNSVLSWLLTFNFVNIAWVYFRAETVTDANKLLKAMLGANGLVVSEGLERWFGWLVAAGQIPEKMPTMRDLSQTEMGWIIGFLLICLFHKNSIQMKDSLRCSLAQVLFSTVIVVWAMVNINRVSEFIYFNF